MTRIAACWSPSLGQLKRALTLPQLLVVAAVVLLQGACLGERRPSDTDAKASTTASASPTVLQPDDVDDRLNHLILGDRKAALYSEQDPYKGATQPLVTIVEFSDFQCPYCAQMSANLDRIVTAYPNDVRLVFKHFPLPMHADAQPGARATLAAHEQGKFWQMHDRLFANQRAMKPTDVLRYAEEIGLNVQQFKSRRDAADLTQRVADDLALGQTLGVSGTPAVFVNGKPLRGNQPLDKLKAVVEQERRLALGLLEAGSKRNEVYARIMKGATALQAAAPVEDATPKAVDTARAAKPVPPPLKGVPSQVSPPTNFAVPVDKMTAVRGPADALVTIVEFGTITCETCKKMHSVVEGVLARHPEVRFAFRQLPNTDQVIEERTAKSLLAAIDQDKFWALHAKLVEAGTYDARKLNELVASAGLDDAEFRASLLGPRLADRIELDAATARAHDGSAAAPLFFVNGRALSGTPNAADFERLIAEESKKATTFMAKSKLSRGPGLYAAMVKSWKNYTVVEGLTQAAAANE